MVNFNQIIFATNNENKIKELNQLLNNTGIKLLGLNDINCKEELPENQDTLEGNAMEKAKYLFDNYAVNCFADDTGLEIEALSGRPGVFSARYAGLQRDANDNMDKILNEMIHHDNRNAQFRTVIGLIINGKEYFFEGIIKGKILEGKTGDMGFGYDPIFMPDGFDKSFAEMSLEEKNTISHRAIAVGKLVAFLSNSPQALS